MKQQVDLRRHTQSLLRRNGRHYKAETQNKTHWTKHHYCWLERTAEESFGSFVVNLRLLLRQAWVGMDIREYSSGGKHHRFGITKQGNRYLRTAFIEANQRAYRKTKLSREIKTRRANTNPEYIAIADRCLRRLSKKGNRLLEAGKHPNKVKVACAREMIGFVWESLNKVAA